MSVVTAYQFAPSSKVRGVDADTAGRALARLLKTGPLTAERVLNAARRESHPLHPVFEWDDGAAAEQYRLEQARHLSRSVRVVTETGETEPLVVHVVHEKCGGSAYVATVDIANDDELHAAAVAEALRLLNGVAHRFRYLDELSVVWAAVEEARSALEPVGV
jgi:hypothetical protein